MLEDDETSPREDYEQFKAVKIVISLMQKSLDEKRRKQGITAKFGDNATKQGLVGYYTSDPTLRNETEVPDCLYTPWGNFPQVNYNKEQTKERRLVKKKMYDDEHRGTFYAIMKADSIELPKPSKNPISSNAGIIQACQTAWQKLEKRYAEEEKQDTMSTK
jgi:hypothetical protein